ncbi:MAG: hypothetical protein PHS57_05510 [Alphaproteobacteria bacterium]|nr:hypothetical protein [Alphaproteobacteria bacterium]
MMNLSPKKEKLKKFKAAAGSACSKVKHKAVTVGAFSLPTLMGLCVAGSLNSSVPGDFCPTVVVVSGVCGVLIGGFMERREGEGDPILLGGANAVIGGIVSLVLVGMIGDPAASAACAKDAYTVVGNAVNISASHVLAPVAGLAIMGDKHPVREARSRIRGLAKEILKLA